MPQRTQVAIIGGGPSGLLLSLLLRRNGIDSIVIERRSRQYVEGRIRAGLLESGTLELLQEAGVGDRALREGLVHEGFELAFGEGTHRIAVQELTGRSVLVYGQTEIQRDLAEAAQNVLWEVPDARPQGFDGDAPLVSYTHAGKTHELRCDFVAGCDGFHGVSRASVPADRMRTFEKVYPFGWMGVLADVPPLHHELVYARHERGFALCSMRSATRSRYYIQCPLNADLGQWTDDRFWEELATRLPASYAARLQTGASIEKSIAPLRSFVAEPMRFGRLFLVGDAAHIVPPTGAKGLNLAAADVRLLNMGLMEYYRSGSAQLLDEYSARALSRVWKATRFSWAFTLLMHQFSDDPFARQLQLAELEYLAGSRAASTAMAENYVGLPFGS